jgi:hypothetical protein
MYLSKTMYCRNRAKGYVLIVEFGARPVICSCTTSGRWYGVWKALKCGWHAPGQHEQNKESQCCLETLITS